MSAAGGSSRARRPTGSGTPAATAAFAGLETRLHLAADADFVAVEALGDDGEVLAASAPVGVSGGS